MFLLCCCCLKTLLVVGKLCRRLTKALGNGDNILGLWKQLGGKLRIQNLATCGDFKRLGARIGSTGVHFALDGRVKLGDIGRQLCKISIIAS